jgi:uncharacterized protein (DUF2267 family)
MGTYVLHEHTFPCQDEFQREPKNQEAKQRTQAVFATLREAITLGEFRDVLEQLDPEYADLLA